MGVEGTGEESGRINDRFNNNRFGLIGSEVQTLGSTSLGCCYTRQE